MATEEETGQLVSELEDAVHHPESWDIPRLLMDAAKAIRRLTGTTTPLSAYYPDDLCPACGEVISAETKDGDKCSCGFVFQAAIWKATS